MAGTTNINPGLLNGPVYKAARYTSEYVNVPPSFHRLYNAIGLTAGLYLGRKLMDIMVGQKPDGTVVEKDEIPLPLRPLHGVLHYDHFSDTPSDRWMKVFDRLVPAATGAIGAGLGSSKFFDKSFIKPVETTITTAANNPKAFTLFEAERQALYHQSKPWSLLTGISALFGSASGSGLFPSIGHYGADLGTLFAMRAERAAAPLGRLVNSNVHIPLRPTKLIKGMVEYAAGNPAGHLEQLEDCAHGILKTWFRGVKPEQVKAFAKIVNDERSKFLKNGKLPETAEKAVAEAIHKLTHDAGLEKTLIKVGLDPREASLGDQGFVSIIGQVMGNAAGQGTSKKMETTWKQLVKGMELRHPELVGKAYDATAHKFKHDAVQKIAAGTAIGVGMAGIGLISSAKDADIGDIVKEHHKKNPHLAPKTHDHHNLTRADESTADSLETTSSKEELAKFSQRVGKHKHILHSKKDNGFLNGKLLDAAEGITDTFNVVNGIHSHRLYCAVGLSAGSYLGEEFMKAVTGVSFVGHKVKKEDVLQPFQKLYKCMAFNPHSDLPADKWMQVLRWVVPTAIGGATVAYASTQYFYDRHKKVRNATYLDDVETKAELAQAEPWTVGAAVTALFGGSSGFAWVPGINYMTHLGTRYSMASGRKVSMPGLGKVWSNNSTLFPFTPPGMIDLLIKEAINNKAYSPELLETYAIGVLKPWFDNVTPEQVESFVSKVYEVRDKFYKDGGVPENLKKQMEEDMKAHLKGAGLEETLLEIGLNPLNATIANNGLSGKIAEATGAKKPVEKIRADYRAGYAQRLDKYRTEHPNGADSIALGE